MTKIYALYHGDRFIDLGTREYLANKLGVKKETITYYMSPTWLRRTNYKSYVVIVIDDEGVED